MKKLILGAMLGGLPSAAWADGAVLKAISGPVTIESGSSMKSAREGQLIGRQDRVHVGAGAVAQIVFADGNAMLVKENSIFKWEETKEGALVSFDEGEFLVGLSAKPEKGKTFRVKTPSALLASTGGAFWGKSDSSKTTHCACFAGSLDVLALEKRASLKSNQTLQIARGQAPEAPTVSKIDPIYVETFAVKGSLQGVDAVIKSGKK